MPIKTEACDIRSSTPILAGAGFFALATVRVYSRMDVATHALPRTRLDQGSYGLPRPNSHKCFKGIVDNYLGGAAPNPPEFIRHGGKLRISDYLRVGEFFRSPRLISVAVPSGYPYAGRSPALPAAVSPDTSMISGFENSSNFTLLFLLRYKGQGEG